MSNNPFQSPEQNPMQQPYQQMHGAPDVSGKVSAPAIALMVVGAINILLALYGLTMGILMMTGAIDVAAQNQDAIRQLEEAGMDQAQIDMMNTFMNAQGPIGLVSNAIALICGIVIVLGAMKMKSLSSYGMAMTGSILAMIPCLSGCCILGLPVGIWAIVVLNDIHVKNAFRANKS